MNTEQLMQLCSGFMVYAGCEVSFNVTPCDDFLLLEQCAVNRNRFFSAFYWIDDYMCFTMTYKLQ